MPSEFVGAVRALVHAREEAGRRVTMPERTVVLAIMARASVEGQDVVDELEAAIAHARAVCVDPGPRDHPKVQAATRLLRAARAVLDYLPPETEPQHPSTTPAVDVPRRADVDG